MGDRRGRRSSGQQCFYAIGGGGQRQTPGHRSLGGKGQRAESGPPERITAWDCKELCNRLRFDHRSVVCHAGNAAGVIFLLMDSTRAFAQAPVLHLAGIGKNQPTRAATLIALPH